MKELSQEELKKKALAREKRGRVVLEAKLQSECVTWWKNTYPELGNRLFAVFNEGRDVTHKIAVGLTPGVPDLLYVGKSGCLFGFELKQKGMYHSVAHLMQQAQWMMYVLPGRAWFCDTLEGFKSAMFNDVSMVFDPYDVMNYLRECKKTRIKWDEISDHLRG